MTIKTKAIAAVALLGIGASLAATPAQARVDTGVAVGAGILGLGVGAAIASDHPHYYERDYRRDDYYAPAPRVAYYPPPAYGYGYHGYRYPEHCQVVDRWNPYWGRYEPVRRCW